MTPQELDHPLQLIVALSRVGEKGVVATSFGVMRLDRFLVPSQRRVEFTHQRDLRVYAVLVSGAMQDENRHTELRGAGHRPIHLAAEMKHSGLRVACREEVLQGFATAA